MVDLYLKATSKNVMHSVMRFTYETLAGVELDPESPTPSQATFASGVGGWVVDDIGTFYDTTDPENPVPREGYHIILRWNGGDAVPSPGPLEIVWRSDAVDGEGVPIPPPEWWNRVLA